MADDGPCSDRCPGPADFGTQQLYPPLEESRWASIDLPVVIWVLCVAIGIAFGLWLGLGA